MSSTLLCSVIFLAWALTPSDAQASCKGRCGAEYYRGSLCQCDYNCITYSECCKDFEAQCTSANSCRGRCGERHRRGRPCDCDAGCMKYKKCCPDFEAQCDEEDEINGATNVAAPVTTNSCNNVNDNNPKELALNAAAEANDAEDNSIPQVNPTLYPQEEPNDEIYGQIFPDSGPEDPEDSLTPDSTSGYETSPADPKTEEEETTPPSTEASPDTQEETTPPSTEAPPDNQEETTPPSTEASSDTQEETTPPSTEAYPDNQEETTPSPPEVFPDNEEETTPPSTEASPDTQEETTPSSTTASSDTQEETTPSPPEVFPDNEEETTPPSTEASPDTQEETTPPSTEASPDTQEETTPPSTEAFPDDQEETTPSSTTASPDNQEETTPSSTTASPDEQEVTTVSASTPAPPPVPDATVSDPKPDVIESNNEATSESTNPETSEPTTKPQDKPVPNKPLPTKPSTDKPASKPSSKPLDDAGQYQADDSNDTNLCSGRPASAVTTLRNGTIVVFRGHYFWFLDRNRVPSPARGITDVWGVPSPIDTSFTRCNCQGKTYIFKGSQYWRFENDALDTGFPKAITTGFDGLRGQITAALSVPQYRTRRESVYFFKRGGSVQKYSYQFGTGSSCGRKPQYTVIGVRNRHARQAVSYLGPQIKIRTAWKGFPTTITSAVSVPSTREPEGYKYYVFSRSKSYNVMMNRQHPVVAPPRPNKPAQSTDFIKCPKKV